MRKLFLQWFAMFFLMLGIIACSEDNGSEGDGGADASSSADGDTDSDADGDTDADTDGDTDADGGADTATSSDIEGGDGGVDTSLDGGPGDDTSTATDFAGDAGDASVDEDSDSDSEATGAPKVIIAEVGVGDPDYIELLNIGDDAVALDGWALQWSGVDYDGTTPVSGEVVIDTFTLGPGERVVIRDNPDIAVEDGEILYEDNLRFGVNDPGAVVLLDDIDTPLDFIRFNDSTTEPPEGVSWDESAGMLVTSQDESKGLSRENETEDNDRSDDFCVAQGTRGAANADCD